MGSFLCVLKLSIGCRKKWRKVRNMRKLVIVKKKKIRIYKSHKHIGKMLTIAAAISMLVGMLPVLAVHAEEDGAIYHKHIGNSESEGGCYGEPIYHVHQGNETEGGACFATPVYHAHQGNEAEGGGCYGEPIYHVHQGNKTEGGSCYKPNRHVHSASCYRTAICNYTLSIGSSYKTWDQWCAHHEMTSHSEAKATAHHGNCGAADESMVVTYCRSCGHGTRGSHEYAVFSCSADTSVITGYTFNCSKTEETVDGYAVNCQKDENTIDSYSQSCEKTGETVDGYDLNCGWDESMPCGKIIVTNETPGRAEKVLLHVTIEDFTGGKLILDEKPYSWQDEEGNLLGEGEYIEIDKNGSYKVSVKLKNEDVDKERLGKNVQVDNVHKPAPGKDDDESDKDEDEKKEDEDKNEENDDTTSEEIQENPIEVIPILPSSEPEQVVVETEVLPPTSTETMKTTKKIATPSPTPTQTPVIKKETSHVELPKNETLEEIEYKPMEIEEKGGFFSLPAVKVISITAGGLLMLGGFGLLFLWKKKSVKLLNDDGEGRLYGVGHCPVVEAEEGYTVYITESMLERSSTNRFCIKPGLFLIGKEEGQELIVCKEQKRISVSLNKEMTFVI